MARPGTARLVVARQVLVRVGWLVLMAGSIPAHLIDGSGWGVAMLGWAALGAVGHGLSRWQSTPPTQLCAKSVSTTALVFQSGKMR